MSKILQKIASSGKKSKIQAALGLTVAAIGFFAPKDSKSYNYCLYGQSGDCELDTQGHNRCISTNWLADCN